MEGRGRIGRGIGRIEWGGRIGCEGKSEDREGIGRIGWGGERRERR